MESKTFVIFYNKEKKEYSNDMDDLVKETLNKFVKSYKSQLKDFIFYYKGTLLNEKHYKSRIKDSIFGNKKNDENINLIAIKITPGEAEEEKSEERAQKEINKIEEEKEEKKNSKKNENKEIKNDKRFYSDIICPVCFTSAIIESDEQGKLNILNCENFHYLKNIPYDIYDDFIFDYLGNESDEAKEKKIKYEELIKCSLCSNYITPPENELYKCSCGFNICKCCLKIFKEEGKNFPGHNNHNQIDLDNRNYFCSKHSKIFEEYCIDCNANYCQECKKIHESHEVFKYNDIKPRREDVENYEKNIKAQKEHLKNFLDSIKDSFKRMIDTVESYLNSYIMIEESLIKRYKDKNLNFQLLRNLNNNNLFNNYYFQKVEEYNSKIDKNDLFSKLEFFLNKLYKSINGAKKEPKNNNDEKEAVSDVSKEEKIIINYEITEPNSSINKIKLFDPIFVQNNKDKVSVIINQKKQNNLKAYYQTIDKETKLEVVLIKGKIKGLKNRPMITDMSYMLNNCKNVTNVTFSNWDTKNVTSMEAMFQLCSFKGAPKLSNLNNKNLQNIRAMFCKCTHISDLSDFEKWLQKDNKIEDISMLFNGCRNLNEINLKYWKTNSVKDMSYLFSRCTSLTKIHGLNNISTTNVTNMCGLFNYCEKLAEKTLSLKNWSFDIVTDMSIMFQGCKELSSIDIGKGNSVKVEDMSGMFSRCEKLTSVPNLKTDSVTKMVGMFNNCKNLNNIGTLKNWKMSKIKDIRGIFYNCSDLKNSKPIENWDIDRTVIENNKDNAFDESGLDGNSIIEKWKKIQNKK